MELETIANQINHHHKKAHAFAVDAVEHAKTAGMLLLQVKDSYPHGNFSRWVKANVQVSLRQCQRYMAVAQGKPIAIRQLAGKNDTVSLLKPPAKTSTGIWKDDHWRPEPWFTYLFRDDSGAYWVTPSTTGAFYVCKHYSGERMTTKGFYWRYTIFSTIHDPDLTSHFYVGTRSAIHNPGGIEGVLKSYGLSDVKSTLVFGSEDRQGNERPFGEPEPEHWYWDQDESENEMFQAMKKMNLVNANGSVVHL